MAESAEEYLDDYVVVTGASSGIGYSTALDLVRHGYRVFGSVRKQADADRLVQDMGPNFIPLLFDVTDARAIQAAAETVAATVGDAGLAGLVNNAGIAVAGPLMHLSVDELRKQFEVNVFGLMAVTQAFLPLLGASVDAPFPAGRIVNISSASSRQIYPFMVPYAASKCALEAFSDGLRRELLLYDIDVILVVPGAVNTPIWNKAEQLDASRYKDTGYAEIVKRMQETVVRLGKQGMPAEKVAETIRLALETPKPKTRYVMANNWLFGWILPKLIPDRWFDRIIGKQFGLTEG